MLYVNYVSMKLEKKVSLKSSLHSLIYSLLFTSQLLQFTILVSAPKLHLIKITDDFLIAKPKGGF